MRGKLLVGVAVLCCVALFFVLDLQRYLDLEVAHNSLDWLSGLYDRQPLAMLGGYFVCYVLMAALSLPGATVLGLVGGAVFGLWVGTLVVSFASTLGATLAFLLSRYLFQDTVQRRFGDRLGIINDGVAREGGWYLFTLRLIPVFPFFLINLLMGLTPIRVWTFYWVSQLGMLAGTMVYINAGRELGRLTSLSGILSPSLIGAFVLLGLFPLLMKKLVAVGRTRLRARSR